MGDDTYRRRWGRTVGVGLHPVDGLGGRPRDARPVGDLAAERTVLAILRSPAVITAQFAPGEYEERQRRSPLNFHRRKCGRSRRIESTPALHAIAARLHVFVRRCVVRCLARFLISTLLLACAAPAFAQSGPWTVSAPANPDHATIAQGAEVVAGYDFIVTPQGGAALPAVSIGKPSIVPSCVIGTVTVQNCITANVDAFIKGLPPGDYTAQIRAIGPGGQELSPAGPPFLLKVPAPGRQGAPGVSRSSGAL